MSALRLLAPVMAVSLLLTPPRLRAARRTEVDVVVDFTAAGRKVAHPDAAHPAYYLPIIGPFQQSGQKVSGERPPSARGMAHRVAVALAQQGYFVMNPGIKGRAPSLILTIWYGYMNPEIEGVGSDGPPGTDDEAGAPGRVFLNETQMLSLVGGANAMKSFDLYFAREAVMQAATEDRYFVIVSAYDFREFRHQRKKVLLWTAKMSAPSAGLAEFSDVADALVRTGAPYFGRELAQPKVVVLPLAPDGHVEIGTPTVKGYTEAAPDAPAK